MRKRLLLPAALIGVTATGVFAAGGIGNATSDRSDLAGDRERVKLDVERAPVPAGTASAITSAKKKKPKILHFVASEAVAVPDGGASNLVSLTCPGKSKLLSGDYATNGGVVADFFAATSAKRFEFGFVDTNIGNHPTDPEAASVGIFCAKGVK
jgi:hypothetical protein